MASLHDSLAAVSLKPAPPTGQNCSSAIARNNSFSASSACYQGKVELTGGVLTRRISDGSGKDDEEE